MRISKTLLATAVISTLAIANAHAQGGSAVEWAPRDRVQVPASGTSSNSASAPRQPVSTTPSFPPNWSDQPGYYKPNNLEMVYNRRQIFFCSTILLIDKMMALIQAKQIDAAINLKGCMWVNKTIEAVHIRDIGLSYRLVTWASNDGTTVDMWTGYRTMMTDYEWRLLECERAGETFINCTNRIKP